MVNWSAESGAGKLLGGIDAAEMGVAGGALGMARGIGETTLGAGVSGGEEKFCFVSDDRFSLGSADRFRFG